MKNRGKGQNFQSPPGDVSKIHIENPLLHSQSPPHSFTLFFFFIHKYHENATVVDSLLDSKTTPQISSKPPLLAVVFEFFNHETYWQCRFPQEPNDDQIRDLRLHLHRFLLLRQTLVRRFPPAHLLLPPIPFRYDAVFTFHRYFS